MPSFAPVEAVSRALCVLRTINEIGSASIADLHKHTRLHKSTILRMLETLIHEGYVVRLEDDARYEVTIHALQLSSGYKAHATLVRAADMYLAKFRRRFGWPSALALPDQATMVIATINNEKGTLQVNQTRGERAPMLATSLGRAYFSYCDEEEQERLLKMLQTPPVDRFDKLALDRKAVKKIVQQTRARGYATPDPQYVESKYVSHLSALGAPVFMAGKVAGSINVLYLQSGTSKSDAMAVLAPALVAVAEQISAAVS
jgi:IclR family mhp operon transcriptional activator